jgi:branched-chain amino acid aminotransferase
MSKHCLINGQVVDVTQAQVSVFDHGFTVGDGVFETLKIDKGVVFALKRHLARLKRSAQIVGLPDPDEGLIRNQVDELLAVDAPSVPALARLRITLTAGVGPLGSDRSSNEPTLTIVWDELAPSAPTAQLATAPWPRPTSAAALGAKTTSYIENVMALRMARGRQCSEGLLLNDQGFVCEGTGSNVMAVIDGVINTPPVTDGCLAGVTRELVTEWFDVVEKSITPEHLVDAEEVFLTSTTRDVQPVDRIDDVVLKAPGPVSARLRAAFVERAKNDPDP